MSHQIKRSEKPLPPILKNDTSPQADGLIGWWPGDGAGTILRDKSGFQNDGILTNFAQPLTRASGWVNGRNGGATALAFDGSDDYVELTAARSAKFYFSEVQAFSVSMWLNITSPVNAYAFILGIRAGTEGNGWYLYWDRANARFIFGYSGSNFNSTCERYTTSSVVPYGKWVNVTCTRDSTNTGAGTKVFINGNEDVGTTLVPNTPNGAIYGSNKFGIGKNPQPTAYAYLGSIEDVKIWNKAISLSRIAALASHPTQWSLGQRVRRKRSIWPVPAGTVFNKSASNTLSLTQTASKIGDVHLSPSNTLVLSQSATLVRDIVRSASSTFGLTQSATLVRDIVRSASSTFGLTQSVFPQDVIVRNADSTLALTHSATLIRDIVRSADSTLALTQSGTLVRDIARSTSNTLVLTQAVVSRGPIYVSASNTIGFTQGYHSFRPQQHVTSSVVFVGTATLAHSYLRNVTHTLSFLNVADVTKLHLTASTLVLSQSATVEQTRGSFSTLVLTQSASVKLDPHNESIQQILVFDHSAVGHIERSFTLTSTLTFTGVATVQRWRYASAFSVLPITQNLIPIRIASVTSTLVLTQVATAVTVHNRRAFSNLVFTESATRIMDYHRAAANTLVFNEHFHQIRDQSGGYITQPIVIGLVAPRLVILQIPGLAITLPKPLLGDAEGNLNSIAIKRTETDETYTYVRQSAARSLKYKFSITRAKAYEMRNFVQYALASKITMTNWKGEIWYGNLMNNPFEFTGQGRASPCGETWEIDFEFEGIRLN